MRVCRATMRRAIIAAVLLVLPAVVFAAGVSPQDRALLAAREAFVCGDEPRLAGYIGKLRGHLLESYPAFWQLQLQIEEADPREVQDFLIRNRGTVLAERMRRDWLRVLGKNGQWDLFRQEFPQLVQADFEVDGYALQERWRRQDPSVSAEIRSLWKSPRLLPAGSAPVVEAMVQSGALSPRDLRDRFRLLVQAGLVDEAKRVAGRLPAGENPAGSQIDEATRAPARYLERSVSSLEKASARELAIAALIGVTRNDPQQAFLFWDHRLQKAFPQEDRPWVWAMLATYASRVHLPEALDWFRKAGEQPLTDEQLAWQTRIALRQGNWTDVKNAIERMSVSARRDPAWTYWLGRACCALGAFNDGRALFGSIAGEHHFYGRLAAEETGIPLEIPPKATPASPEEVARVAAIGGIARSLALYGLGLRTEALDEWRWAIQGMDDRTLLAAAELAGRNGIWDRSINTANKTNAVHDFKLRYPEPYGEILRRQACLRSIEDPLVFGLVRQESRFLADVRSSAGAEGLMQVMPSTARLVAKAIGMKNFRTSQLNGPEVNAELGTCYLRQMLDRFGGDAVLALAAYNAGPIRASRWQDAKPLEGAIYVETIPFSETRQYVKNVMTNTLYYAALSGGEQRSIKSRLGTVSARTARGNGNGGDE